MTEPTITDESATPTAAPAPKARSLRFRGRRSAGQALEGNSVVQRPSTVIFQASPSTISASLAKVAGDTTEPVIVWGPGSAAHLGEWHHPGRGSAPGRRRCSSSAPAPTSGNSSGSPSVRIPTSAPPRRTAASPNWPRPSATTRRASSTTATPSSTGTSGRASSSRPLEATRAAFEHKGRWVALVDASQLPLDTLDRMFPTARIVHVVADGWSRRSARTVRGQALKLSKGRYLEVRARDLESDPATVKQAVLEFIGEVLGTVGGGAVT